MTALHQANAPAPQPAIYNEPLDNKGPGIGTWIAAVIGFAPTIIPGIIAIALAVASRKQALEAEALWNLGERSEASKKSGTANILRVTAALVGITPLLVVGVLTLAVALLGQPAEQQFVPVGSVIGG